MRRAIRRAVLRFQLWRLSRRIEAQKSRIDDVFVERWAALEAMDASGYDTAAANSLVLKQALRRLKTQRDEITRQLERL